jgi:predicted nucleotidyltransferase
MFGVERDARVRWWMTHPPTWTGGLVSRERACAENIYDLKCAVNVLFIPVNAPESQMSPDQTAALRIVAEWADLFPCINSVYVFGSFARGDQAAKDIDIAIEYSDGVRSRMRPDLECYTNVNLRSLELQQALEHAISISVGWTGLASLREPYDQVAWNAIRTGREMGSFGKAKLIATEPKPSLPEG